MDEILNVMVQMKALGREEFCCGALYCEVQVGSNSSVLCRQNSSLATQVKTSDQYFLSAIQYKLYMVLICKLFRAVI